MEINGGQILSSLIQEGGKIVAELIRTPRASAKAKKAAEKDAAEAISSSKSPEVVTRTPPAAGNKPIVNRDGLDDVRMGYQEDLALGEAWLLEAHLKENCKSCGGDVECCWKHSDNTIRVANETMSMTTDPFWRNLKDLATEIKSKSHPDDVRAGTYVADYPGLAIRVSEFRVPLQKKQMGRVKPNIITLDEAKSIAAKKAAAEVERQWHSQEKK